MTRKTGKANPANTRGQSRSAGISAAICAASKAAAKITLISNMILPIQETLYQDLFIGYSFSRGMVVDVSQQQTPASFYFPL
ncbi:MAG: hypothetical protein R6U64_03740 [Bacteroidales bacterium]